MRDCIPAGWKTTTIGELAHVLRGVTYKKAQSAMDERENYVPLLRATNITQELVFSDFVYVPRELVKDEQMLQPGDSVIAASSGSLSVVGKSAPLRHKWEGTFGAFCFALRPDSDAVAPLYLAHYLQTSEYRGTVGQLAAGVNINNLKRQHLEDMAIPFAPVPEQHRIVEAIESYLTRLDDAVASLSRVQRNLKRYRASVLKAAVEGRLVPTEACLCRARHGRQAELARQEGRDLPAPQSGTFYVYAIECEGGSHYIGQTDNIRRRWTEHMEGKGASWTKQHKPVRLIHWEEYNSREEAVEREKHLKTGFGRKWLKREIATGRTRQAGYEPASELLERILAERKARWIEDAVEKARAKANGNADALLQARKKAEKKYKEPEPPDTTDLPTLPEGWCWTSLDQFLVGIDAGKNFRCHEQPPGQDEVGVVKVSSVSWGEFRELESKTCTDPDKVDPRAFIYSSDFLMSRANTIELVGACVIVAEIGKTLMLSDKILRLRLAGAIDQWILHVLRSSFGRREIENLATGNQESMRNISQRNMRRIRVPLPPEMEISRILDFVASTHQASEAARGSVDSSRRRALALRQSILKWAFEGKLMEQNPDDEPASALLERIKAERESAIPEKSKRRAKKGNTT